MGSTIDDSLATLRPAAKARNTAVAILPAAVLVGLGAAEGVVAGVLTLVIAVLALVLAQRTDVAGWLLVGVVPVVAGLKRGLPVPGLRASEVLAIALGLFLIVAVHDASTWRWRVVDWLMVGYAGATLAIGSLALAADKVAITAKDLGTMVAPLGFVVLCLGVQRGVASPSRRRTAVRILLLVSAPVSLLALLQYFDVPGIRSLLAELIASDNFERNQALGYQARATGPFSHWHSLGGYLVPVMLVGSALLLEKEQAVMRRWQLNICVSLALVALVVTYTFAAYFGFLVGIVLLAVWARGVRKVLGAVVAGVFVIALVFGPAVTRRVSNQRPDTTSATATFVPQTLQYRFDVWKYQYLPAIKARPLIGYGPIIPDTVRWRYSESLYLSLLLRGGVALLLAYLALVWAILAECRPRMVSEDPIERSLARALVAIVGVFFVTNMVYPYFLDNGFSQIFWVLVGLVLARSPGQGRPFPPFPQVTQVVVPRRLLEDRDRAVS